MNEEMEEKIEKPEQEMNEKKEEKQEKEVNIKQEQKKEEIVSGSDKLKCQDIRCPFHGKLRVHGRVFKGIVKKIIGKRAVIEFERLARVKKYERYMKKRTRLHAHIPECIEVAVNDLVKIRECRPLSKITHFVILKKLSIKDKIINKK